MQLEKDFCHAGVLPITRPTMTPNKTPSPCGWPVTTWKAGEPSWSLVGEPDMVVDKSVVGESSGKVVCCDIAGTMMIVTMLRGHNSIYMKRR